jgi:hypothetical protein
MIWPDVNAGLAASTEDVLEVIRGCTIRRAGWFAWTRCRSNMLPEHACLSCQSEGEQCGMTIEYDRICQSFQEVRSARGLAAGQRTDRHRLCPLLKALSDSHF